MITFKAIIIPNNRRKDGTYPVKIRVTFKGVTRRLPTTLVCHPQDITRGNRIKNADILSKADELINRMRSAIKDISPFDLECRDVDWVVNHIKDRLAESTFRLDFFEWCDRYVMTKEGTTRNGYKASLNALERFLGRRTLDINDISRMMLLDFVDFVDNEKSCKPASGRHLMKLQHMFNAAKDRFNDEDADRIVIPKSPFDKITKIFPPCDGQKNLGQPLMQRIISCQTNDPVIRYALDAFIVSFGTMGANMADLFYATPFKETWIYNRQKTKTRRADKAEMRVEIPSVLQPYIERLQSHRIPGWWLPTLHHLANREDTCNSLVNRAIKRWCKQNDIPEFTFYAARHTWASLARRAGVEKATIDECLVHKGSLQVADIYIERDWDLINQANAKVLDLFSWE